MNQTQRDYLIEQVRKTCQEQITKLEKTIPDRPSLNNYLIAAFLDDTIKFTDVNVLKEKLRAAVLKYGTSDQLVREENEYGRRNRNRDKDKEFVCIDPNDLFIIPESYLVALKEYDNKYNEIQEKIKMLEATEKTIVMKLQIGSSGVLDKLIMQVDSMGDLNLMNTQLLLGNDSKGEPK